MSVISAGNTTSTAVVISGDTTGNLVFATGGSNATALTISNTQAATFAGTLATTSRGISAASVPVGSVIQTVVSSYSTQVTSTSATFADMGLSATITPLYTTSKVLVTIDLGGCGKNSGDTWLAIKVQKNNADWKDINNFVGYTGSSLPQFFGSCTLNTLDATATNSSITYKIQLSNVLSAGTVYVNSGGGSSITLMEIAQ
jgi:hypothetical protein